MQYCQIQGDMVSDKSSENYPVVAVCDECYQVESQGEEPKILSIESKCGDEYAECVFCGLSYEEEFESKYGASRGALEEELEELENELEEIPEEDSNKRDIIIARIEEIENILN